MGPAHNFLPLSLIDLCFFVFFFSLFLFSVVMFSFDLENSVRAAFCVPV